MVTAIVVEICVSVIMALSLYAFLELFTWHEDKELHNYVYTSKGEKISVSEWKQHKENANIPPPPPPPKKAATTPGPGPAVSTSVTPSPQTDLARLCFINPPLWKEEVLKDLKPTDLVHLSHVSQGYRRLHTR